MYFRRNADYEKLVEVCTKRLRANPKNLRALLIRAGSYVKKELFREALADYDAILALDEHHVDAHFQRGSIYQRFDDPRSAIRDFTRVLELDGLNVKALYARAACHNLMQEYALAIEDYNRALELDQELTDRRKWVRSARRKLPVTGGAVPLSDNAYSDTSGAVTADHDDDGDEGAESGGAGAGAGAGAAAPGPVDNAPTYDEAQVLRGGRAGDDLGGALEQPPSAVPSAPSSQMGDAPPSARSLASPRPASAAGHRADDTQWPDGARAGALDRAHATEPLKAPDGARGAGSREPGGAARAATPGGDKSKASSQADYHHSRGYAFRKQNNFRAAVEEYTKALAHDSRHFKALFNR